MNRSRGSRATWQWKINSRDAVIAVDYEVLGLEVVKPLFLQICFIHDQCSWIGGFVGELPGSGLARVTSVVVKDSC
jgi:hypothetical protein